MNSKKLKKLGILAITLVIGFTLVQTTVGNGKNVVERPFKLKSEGCLDFSTGKSVDIGEGSHIGRCVGEGQWIEGVADYILYAANGDEIYCTVYRDDSETTPDLQWSGSGHGIYEGGTGRFTDLYGETEWSGEGFIDPDENKLYYQLTVEGWFSY